MNSSHWPTSSEVRSSIGNPSVKGSSTSEIMYGIIGSVVFLALVIKVLAWLL